MTNMVSKPGHCPPPAVHVGIDVGSTMVKTVAIDPETCEVRFSATAAIARAKPRPLRSCSKSCAPPCPMRPCAAP